jgi:hypothetical protein
MFYDRTKYQSIDGILYHIRNNPQSWCDIAINGIPLYLTLIDDIPICITKYYYPTSNTHIQHEDNYSLIEYNNLYLNKNKNKNKNKKTKSNYLFSKNKQKNIILKNKLFFKNKNKLFSKNISKCLNEHIFEKKFANELNYHNLIQNQFKIKLTQYSGSMYSQVYIYKYITITKYENFKKSKNFLYEIYKIQCDHCKKFECRQSMISINNINNSKFNIFYIKFYFKYEDTDYYYCNQYLDYLYECWYYEQHEEQAEREELQYYD